MASSLKVNKRKLIDTDIDTIRIIYNEVQYPLVVFLELDGTPMIDIDIASIGLVICPYHFKAGNFTPINVTDTISHRFISLDSLLQQVQYISLDQSSWNAVRLYLSVAEHWKHLMEMESRISILHFIICVAFKVCHLVL